ncbi:MAG: DNA repair protein RecO [Patescibacteria group bacterium]
MQAIVLSRRDFRESDQMISVYTKEKGKLNLLARGVKKIISKNSAHLEPFSLVDIEIAHGKGIDHLTKVVPVNYFSNIRADLQKSLAVGFVVSTTDKLLHTNEPDKRIFDLLKSWLESISDQLSVISDQLIDDYIVKLLHCLGYDIQTVKSNPDHDFIYQFLLFHTERKIADWGEIF